MKPKTPKKTHAQPLIGWRLDMVLDPENDLFRLTQAVPWDSLSSDFGTLYCSDIGRPGIPVRLMAGLVLLQHTFSLSDEEVVRRWPENPYWQFFCGEEFFRHDLPIHPSQMTRWRKRIGEAGCQRLLSLTIEAGRITGTINERSCEKVIVDTTVQPKAIQHPTDARLYRKVHQSMLRIAAAEGLALRQSYTRVAKYAFLKQARHMKAKQFKRARKEQKKLRVVAGRVMRDVCRKLSDEGYAKHRGTLLLSELVMTQKRKTKNKIYSLHAPEVECIAKGKAHRPYEFGVKASLATTLKEGFIVGAMACPGNPFDGHTLDAQLDQIEALTGQTPKRVFVDMGYKGHGIPPERSQVFISRTRNLPQALKRELRRRSAIEPEIGHMKSDGKLGRNHLKGELGDAMNVLLCGAGHNLRKILARIRALLRLFFGDARFAVETLLNYLGAQRPSQTFPRAA